MPITNLSGNATFSIDNTTLKPLSTNGSFVGKWEDVSQFSILYTLWRTDVAGIMYYEFSMDGVIVDRSFQLNTVDLTDGNYGSTGPRGRYFRIRYANGNSPQTIFRLQTTYSLAKSDDAHAAVIAGVSPKSNSMVTRSVIHGKTPTNGYAAVKVAADGTLIINTDSAASLIPNSKTNKLITTSVSADQVILTYTPSQTFRLSGWSTYAWDTMNSYQVVFGEASLESPEGTKLYTSQLTSMGGGKDIISLSQPLIFPANQTVRLVCSPSAPITQQTWQGNLIGLS